MFLHIQDVLTADEVALFRQQLWAADAPWIDGARSAGGQAVHQKNNLQLAQGSDLSSRLQGLVKAALHRNALFFSAALPHRISSFFWVESMVRGLEQRQLLFDMDMSLLKLRQAHGEQEPSVIALSGTYHNLLRMWADV